MAAAENRTSNLKQKDHATFLPTAQETNGLSAHHALHGSPMDPETSRTQLVRELRMMPLFELLSDEQVRWLIEHSELLTVPAGRQLIARGQADAGFFVLLDGELQIVSDFEGRERVVASSDRPGAYAGAVPLVDDAPMVGARMGRAGHVLRIPDAFMREMLVSGYPIAKHLILGIEERARVFQSLTDHQEKLASLGKLSAGLAHELNNPAAAARRSASELQEVIEELGATHHILATVDPHVLEALRAALQKRQESLSPLGSLEQSDREEAVGTWLETQGVADPWNTAAALVSSGADLEWLERETAQLSGAALSGALRWLAAYSTAVRLAHDVMESAARISHHVDTVKSFTYMDRAPVQEVNLHEGIEVTLSLLHHKMGNVRIERRYDPELPVLHTHGGELNQVWMNLLDNALDALAGSGTITIRSSHDRTGVCVEISDDGPGIPAEIQQRIFDPFFTTKEVGKGAGLGLDIARRIITRSHGGEVCVDSEPGHTTFHVWLPVSV